MDNPRILIVEDDPDVVEMLSMYFGTQEYEVVSATWGQEALDISQQVPLSLVILDIHLPDIDGFEVCRQLRLSRRTQDVPIIFLTQKNERTDKLHGLELGVVDYVTKPFDMQELILRVRNAITHSVRQTVVHAITDLPEGAPVEERLGALATSEGDWAVLRISLIGLNEFREAYGFVQADEVLRAVALMIRNAMREHGTGEEFLGHLSAEEFLVVTTTDKAEPIRERIHARMRQSREYFYPLKDQEPVRQAAADEHLRLDIHIADAHSGPYLDGETLRHILYSSGVA